MCWCFTFPAVFGSTPKYRKSSTLGSGTLCNKNTYKPEYACTQRKCKESVIRTEHILPTKAVATNRSIVLVTAKSIQKDSYQPKASVAHSYMCPGSAFRSTAEAKKTTLDKLENLHSAHAHCNPPDSQQKQPKTSQKYSPSKRQGLATHREVVVAHGIKIGIEKLRNL